MLQELSDESRRIGMTKVMVVDNTPIDANNVVIENVEICVYLGQHCRMKEKNQAKEIQWWIMAGWAAYAKPRDIFRSNLAICLKRQVYNSCVLPDMTHGAENWTLTKQTQHKLAAAQTKMERSMLNITYKDRRTSILVREWTKVIYIISNVRTMKWSWTEHTVRLKDDRCTSSVNTWRPYDNKRRQGRPAKRWRDDLDKYWRYTIWQRTSQYRLTWRRRAEAFNQPRDNNYDWPMAMVMALWLIRLIAVSPILSATCYTVSLGKQTTMQSSSWFSVYRTSLLLDLSCHYLTSLCCRLARLKNKYFFVFPPGPVSLFSNNRCLHSLLVCHPRSCHISLVYVCHLGRSPSRHRLHYITGVPFLRAGSSESIEKKKRAATPKVAYVCKRDTRDAGLKDDNTTNRTASSSAIISFTGDPRRRGKQRTKK